MFHSTRKLRAWQEASRIPLFLLALTVFYFWPQLAEHRALYWGDIGLYFLPLTGFLHDQLHQGQIPLWNPWLLCGTPFAGNPQTWPFYPISALLMFVSASSFLSLTIALHVWLASCGAYLFLRRAMLLNRSASVIGAIVFAFGGQLISKEQFPNMVQAIAWLPWILLCVHTLTHGWRVTDALRLGLCLGLQILAAHAQMTVLTLYLATAYGAVQLVSVRTRLPVILARLSLTGLVAAGICACQVLPTLELYRDAWRQKLSFHVVNRFYLPVDQMANFVAPSLHGHPFTGNFMARGNYWETCCYVGVFAFALACVGAWASLRRNAPQGGRFWVVILILGVWLALGGPGGLYRVAYTTLPGFRAFHDPARCLLLASWAAAVLCAVGWQWCASRLKPNVYFALTVLLIGLIFSDLAHFGRTLYPLANAPVTAVPAELSAIQRDPAFAAHQARLMAPDTTRTWQRFTSVHAYRQDVPGYAKLWADTLTPNLPLTFGIPDAFGYEPVARRDAQTVSGAAADTFRPEASAEQRATAAVLAGIMGVRVIAFLRTMPPATVYPGLLPLETLPALQTPGAQAETAHIYLTVNTKWLPRARLTTHIVCVSTHAAALTLLTRAAPNTALLDLHDTTIIAAPRSPAEQIPPMPLSAGSATITADTPDSVEIVARSTAPCVLVLADTLHPGWHATDNNRRVPILSADGFLRAVTLPHPGLHHIVVRYAPTSVLLGLYFTLLTCGGLIAYYTARVMSESGNSGLRRH